MNALDDPLGNIERLYRFWIGKSEQEALDELSRLSPLPPYRGQHWDDDEPWARAQLLVALSAVAAERQIVSALPLILDRMCLGDPGEMMRGMRHALEAAVGGNWGLLVRVCIQGCASPSPGARYWCVQELGVLRDGVAVQPVIRLLDDSELEIAEEACATLVQLARACPAIGPNIVEALRVARGRPELAHAADEALRRVDTAET